MPPRWCLCMFWRSLAGAPEALLRGVLLTTLCFATCLACGLMASWTCCPAACCLAAVEIASLPPAGAGHGAGSCATWDCRRRGCPAMARAPCVRGEPAVAPPRVRVFTCLRGCLPAKGCGFQLSTAVA
mmetsp:Transcript_50425/g.132819  ORF Transcript_50425/g.132819 Transcript_50425/m.132819 type:complete len:128 (-) Transcript_50425:16-399(-)